MAQTYFDMGRWTPTESWRAIRSARAEPPLSFKPLHDNKKRLAAFQAALEQAQQQMNAAAAIGYESRPLNLFYGLSQAGRALAAASPLVSNGEWESSSHGLTFTLKHERNIWLEKVSVLPSATDTFSRASAALVSPTDIGSIEIGALAAQLPEFSMQWPDFNGWPSAIGDLSGDPGDTSLTLIGYRGANTVEAIEEWLSNYPSITGLSVDLDEAGNPRTANYPPVPVVGLPSDRRCVLEGSQHPTGLRTYASTEWAMPVAGAASSDLHPLMTWWLLLYALSMLARYHPREWTTQLSLSRSQDASRVEFLLDSALVSVPELLAEALRADRIS